MSLFNKLFGKENESRPIHTDFKTGDIVVGKWGKKFKPYKIIELDEATDTLHVIMYRELSKMPSAESLPRFEVEAEHIPIEKSVIEHPVFIANQTVTLEDLNGYIFYLVHQGAVEQKVKYAQRFYKEAIQCTDQKDHWRAIARYDLASRLIPEFFEAFDNSAFCQMDLGNFPAAISCFEKSLAINANALLPTFSIGECHLKQENYAEAKVWFEKAIAIDPAHPKPKEFLKKAENLLSE